ncbi:PD40 domain-containing protein [Wenjunlia tyrosinilytica]|nr:PD40 domain-containing protein [Wenjunlia tyrosinilytica]
MTFGSVRRGAVAACAMGTAMVAVTALTAGEVHAAGTKPIVFSRYTAGKPVEDLYSISSTGGTLTKLTNTPLVSDVMPSWSPDGSRIALLRYGSGGAIDGIWTMKSSGGTPVHIKGTDGAADPSWSPDGHRIAFSKPVGSHTEIFISGTGGTPLTRLTHNSVDDNNPSWSPDGKYLVFSRTTAGGHSHLKRIRVTTHAESTVTSVGSTYDSAPDWSHGNTIAFSRSGSSGIAHLYVVRPDGSGLHRITSGRLNDITPSWSPDGTRLVFTRGGGDDADPQHLFLVKSDGTGLTRLTKTDSHDIEADWRSF